MKRVLLFVGMILAIGTVQDLRGDAEALKKLLPPPETLDNWTLEFDAEHYTPENLYEYINGEAELYNDYGFVEMMTAYYIEAGDGDNAISVDVYDMGKPLNAFGIYSSYRRPGLEFDSIGEEAIVSGANMRFYKNQYFVQVNGNSMEPDMADAAEKMAKMVAENIPDAEKPETLSLLPDQHQLDHSLTYITKGFLGQSTFGKSLEAGYNIDGEEITGFVIMFDSNESASESLSSFQDFLSESGTIHQSAADGKLIAEERFQGKITASVHNALIAGVYNYENQETAESLLKSILQSIE